MILVGDIHLGEHMAHFSLPDEKIICNLEGPVFNDSDSFTPISKAGPVLKSSHFPETNNQLIFALANNHLMDYGVLGAEATIQKIQDLGSLYVGYGKTLTLARMPLVFEDQGRRFGLLSCCEIQFGAATIQKPGVNPLGPWIYTAISDLKKQVDYIIISIHSGLELSPWPSPLLQESYRSFIDAGANVIHGHHSHVPQGWEIYHGGLILYGCGNFLVSPQKWKELENALWSVGVAVTCNSTGLGFEVRKFQVEETSDGMRSCVAVARDSEYENYLQNCNQPLNDPAFLKALYQEVSLRVFRKYYSGYLGFSTQTGKQLLRVLKSSARKLLHRNQAEAKFNLNRNLLYYHLFSCLSHREAISETLGVLTGEIPDLRSKSTKLMVDEMVPWSKGVLDATPL